MSTWKPSLSIKILKERARIMEKTRSFFKDRNILEVETPLLGDFPASNPYLDSIKIKANNNTYYLQTSPEYCMKRLLSLGSGSIYQICKAFRKNEFGPLHALEFTMLEWYHVGLDDFMLMKEVDLYVKNILGCKPANYISYKSCFENFFDFNPHTVSINKLKKIIQKYQIENFFTNEIITNDDYLQLLFLKYIQPKFKNYDAPIFVYNYPVDQSELARLKYENDYLVSARFELFYRGIELANGYYELNNADTYFERFQRDLNIRKKKGNVVPIDKKLLEAIKYSFPDCSGVAIGLDRLFMLLNKYSSLDKIKF